MIRPAEVSVDNRKTPEPIMIANTGTVSDEQYQDLSDFKSE